MTDTGRFIDQFETIRTHVDVAAFGIPRHRRSRAHVRSAVFLVPTHPREYFKIDVLALLYVLFDGRIVYEYGRHWLKGFHLRIPPAHGFGFTHLGRATVDHLLPL